MLSLQFANSIYSDFINQINGYAVFFMTKHGFIATWNNGANRLKGYRPDEVIGKYYGMLFPEEYQLAGKPEEELAAALEKGSYEVHGWRRRKDGTLFWSFISLTAIFSEEGEHIGFTKVTGDKTEQKELEDKLDQRHNTLIDKNNELTKINHDLDNFVYTASHDLRSPIINIEGLMQVLKEELEQAQCLSDNTEKVVGQVITSVNRFKDTIEDLTEISRMHKNINDGLQAEVIDVKKMYKAVLADLDYPLKQKIGFLQTDFQVKELNFSRKNFRSILYNLISNAIKFQSDQRGCLVQISTRLAAPYVILCVQDNGLGINKRQQEQLFTMFKRFHKHVDGSGIGLFMVKRIVENAGGKIEVESTEDIGTEIKVYFKSAP